MRTSYDPDRRMVMRVRNLKPNTIIPRVCLGCTQVFPATGQMVLAQKPLCPRCHREVIEGRLSP